MPWPPRFEEAPGRGPIVRHVSPLLLFARLHVDLCRSASALCPGSAA
ncbi:putative leader peptide [Actinoallomurus acanthiterrae]